VLNTEIFAVSEKRLPCRGKQEYLSSQRHGK